MWTPVGVFSCKSCSLACWYVNKIICFCITDLLPSSLCRADLESGANNYKQWTNFISLKFNWFVSMFSLFYAVFIILINFIIFIINFGNTPGSNLTITTSGIGVAYGGAKRLNPARLCTSQYFPAIIYLWLLQAYMIKLKFWLNKL